ncbi:hypothetical protein FEM48_Zijuj12G0189500 [Ziziphus jujuba var. spinosa]|uniref:CW-type domain-containing protein n=1 Tax=Ziziphus jujuba var. spinosa TaxID=714518 RepID=A0A978UEZ5_ZIZJJ|nr:hypothetical protein FEM48_Zijuj12G0189500 [Ziziphus jujuba var. spinosa]
MVTLGITARARARATRSLPQKNLELPKCNEEADPQWQSVGQKSTVHEQDERNVPHKEEKPTSEGKDKSKETLGNGKPAAVLTKESLRVEIGAVLDDKKEYYSWCCSSWPKDAYLDDVEAEQKMVLDVSSNTLNGKKLIPAAVTPVVIKEYWVCCDSFQKWRLLPFGSQPKQLPEKWLCRMLIWLPGMNRCDISEETTKALNALYQLPVSDHQSSPQNQANGSASKVTAVGDQHPDQNLHSNNSHSISNQEKNETGIKSTKFRWQW